MNRNQNRRCPPVEGGRLWRPTQEFHAKSNNHCTALCGAFRLPRGPTGSQACLDPNGKTCSGRRCTILIQGYALGGFSDRPRIAWAFLEASLASVCRFQILLRPRYIPWGRSAPGVSARLANRWKDWRDSIQTREPIILGYAV